MTVRMPNDSCKATRLLAVMTVCALASIFAAATAARSEGIAPPAGKAASPAKAKEATVKPAGKNSVPKPPPPAVNPYPAGLIERHAKHLGLAAETVAKIRTTIASSRRESEKLRGQFEEAQGKLRALLAEDAPDERAVMAQADELGALMSAQRKNQLRTILTVRSLLTPEQRAELERIRREQRKRP